MIHLDTSFLVDLLRESRRGRAGRATAKLEELADAELGISLFVLCELEAGVQGSEKPDAERHRVAAITAPLAIALPDSAIVSIYGELLQALSRQRKAIATMDLLIAAAALAEGAPLVTGNARHFNRVPGLEVVTY